MADRPAVDRHLEAAIDAMLFDRPVAYHPAIARAVGSVTAGVLMSQLLYWTPRTQDADKWFWKTREQIAAETALTRTEQENARKMLVKAGVLEEKRAGVPARIHFRINLKRLKELLANQLAGFPPTEGQVSRQLDGGNPANWTAAILPANSEITSEITSEKLTDAWKTELAATMTASNYRRWIAPLELVELVNHHAVLFAPDTSTADYARTRLADTLARALNVERIDIQTAKGKEA